MVKEDYDDTKKSDSEATFLISHVKLIHLVVHCTRL